ncbi:hypothetical protein B0H11DRAFT_2246434 [Mycena galericulata]|nr:hypothetical protein B0H11DRAFT_2246434 [Mycena galericulata]
MQPGYFITYAIVYCSTFSVHTTTLCSPHPPPRSSSPLPFPPFAGARRPPLRRPLHPVLAHHPYHALSRPYSRSPTGTFFISLPLRIYPRLRLPFPSARSSLGLSSSSASLSHVVPPLKFLLPLPCAPLHAPIYPSIPFDFFLSPRCAMSTPPPGNNFPGPSWPRPPNV